MKIEIVDTTAEHVRILARTMRDEDRAEIAMLGGDAWHTPHRLFRDSHICRTALIDGVVSAVWGLQGGLLDFDGEPWLFTTPLVERARMAFVRTARVELHGMLETKHSLVTRVAPSYARSIRLFEALGFGVGPVVTSVDGARWREMRLDREPRWKRVVYRDERDRSVSVVDAQVSHLDVLSRRLRTSDVEELAGYGLTPRQALEGGLHGSTRAWTALAGREPFCLFGVVPPIDGEPPKPWLVGTDGLCRHWGAFLRFNRRMMPEMLALHGRLADVVEARNAVSLRWLRWLGFQVHSAVARDSDGEPVHLFEMEA
jgi:hypothetical protein